MTIEENIDRIARALESIAVHLANPLVTVGEDPKPSKAGRKAKGEVDGAAVKPAAEQPAPAEIAVTATTPAAPAATAPVGTKEAMKAAVLAYRDATDQDTALKLLTAVGADSFGTVKPEFYQQVTDAAVAALAAVKPKVEVKADPFDDGETVVPAPSLADVKKAFLGRQKDVSESALIGLLGDLGAVGPGEPGKPPTPSLKFLAVPKYAEAIAKVQALPKTK